jgi:hypothetical protein
MIIDLIRKYSSGLPLIYKNRPAASRLGKTPRIWAVFGLVMTPVREDPRKLQKKLNFGVR